MLTLVIANKAYSSWSLRPWLLLRVLDIPFEEVLIPLGQADTAARIAHHSPAGKVPVLRDGELILWESTAIIDHVAERFPEAPVWPRDPAARALARSASAEMHAGFAALRTACPMNLRKRFAARDRGEAVARDVARVTAIWREARERFGAGGPFLFGAFSAADAMYAPVATRFATYSVPVEADTQAYMEAVLSLPAFRAWAAAAMEEPWTLPRTEVAEPVLGPFPMPR